MIHNSEDFQAARARWTQALEAGRLDEALVLVEEALVWAEASGEECLRDRTLCNRAAIALELGAGAQHVPSLRAMLLPVEEAIAAYEEALDLLPSRDSLRRAVIGYNLGYCNALTGRSREGLALLYSSLRSLLRRGADGHAMKAQLDLAFALLETSRAQPAGRHAARALALAERLEDSDAQKNALYLLGAAAVATGDRVGARRHFERLQQGFFPEADYLPELLLHVDVLQLVNLKA